MPEKISVNVTGMHCASCAKIIEQELKDEPGLKILNINPLTEQAELEISESGWQADRINKRLQKLGYSFNFPSEARMPEARMSGTKTAETKIGDKLSVGTTEDIFRQAKSQKQDELRDQKRKLSITLPIMTIILIVVFWSLAAPYFKLQPSELIPGPVLLPLVFLVATLVLFWVGRDFLKAAGRFFRYGRANMDTLIGLGTGVAYLYSTIIYLFPAVRVALGLEEMYFFDVTIVVIILVSLGKYLENKAKLRTNETIEKLINLQVKTALVERGGKEMELPISELIVGDIVIVKPGMKIPADGLVIEGESAVDEAIISGESLPIDKKTGDIVIGSTINKQGRLKVKINKVGSETVLAAIIKATQAAQNSKAPIQKLADTVAGIFVPIVLVIAGSTLGAWLIIGPHFIAWPQAVSLGLTCFVSVMAIACPCALGLATPTGITVGLGLASKNGLLIKNASSLEKFGHTKIIVMDKTGTITKGEPTVSDIISVRAERAEILSLAASLEKNSEHPLAQAVERLAAAEKIPALTVDSFKSTTGQGVSGRIKGQEYFLGNLKMMTGLNLTGQTDWPTREIEVLEKQGKTLMILSTEKNILGVLALSDEIKDGATAAIAELKRLGIKTIMLSGDRQEAANYIAQQAGVDEVVAEVSPLGKADRIKEIKNRGGIVAMVGDGINDAVALVASDIGIAMANGSDIAIESADITILHGDLSKIIKALKISRLTIRKIKQNLFWAFFYNIIAIPIAAGALYPAFGILLSPIIAAGAMSFSSISIVLNTLLMRRAKI